MFGLNGGRICLDCCGFCLCLVEAPAVSVELATSHPKVLGRATTLEKQIGAA